MRILTEEELTRAGKDLGIDLEEVKVMYIRALASSMALDPLSFKDTSKIERKKEICFYCGTPKQEGLRLCDRCGGPY